ncbi:MAG TPA: hypothetical protein PKY50_20115 [Candidatus Competibacter sp.]|nr:hypothetical protein [Candidatus Competibacter sp.]
MPTLIVRQVEASGPPHFQVVRLKDGKTTVPVAIVSPASTPVKDLPNSNLSVELRWYLEEFLDYPFPPVTDRAEYVQAARLGRAGVHRLVRGGAGPGFLPRRLSRRAGETGFAQRQRSSWRAGVALGGAGRSAAGGRAGPPLPDRAPVGSRP